ncbi:MAG: hypothetical protein ACXVFL_20220 [Solirubrobacteraceae bacterium]
MTELLLAALERFPPRVRRSVVAAGALLALGAVLAALTLIAPHGGHTREPTLPRPAGTSLPHTAPRGLPPPVLAGPLAVARRVGEWFLVGYLRFAYGRGSALAVSGVTSALRRRLLGQRARLTPVERRRRARVVSLQTIGTTPTFVVATAVIDDGGVATYLLRFTVEHGGGRWAVSGVEVG